MATKIFFSTVPLLTFLALAFTVVNLLLLCNINFTSSTSLTWLSYRYQTDMQVFYITPALLFWFIVVSSVFQLFFFLDRFSPIPPTSSSLKCMDPLYTGHPRVQTPFPVLGCTANHGFLPKYPLKFHQNECWMTCCPPQLPQPTPSFFNLLFMAWICWTHALHSWFNWLDKF